MLREGGERGSEGERERRGGREIERRGIVWIWIGERAREGEREKGREIGEGGESEEEI
jgi:hypothetical protein